MKREYKESLKISIITVSLNEKDHIERNILSVKSQTYKNIEHIFIDGNSTDGTIEIIQKYHKINIVPERGIYLAMNVGSKLVTGDYVLFLNANDWLASGDILEKVVKFIEENPGADLYFGRKQNFNKYLQKTNKPRVFRKSLPKITKLGRFIPHPSSFFSVDWVRNNKYEERITVCADRFYITNVCLKGKVKDMKYLTTNYLRTGISSIGSQQVSKEIGEYYKVHLPMVDLVKDFPWS